MKVDNIANSDNICVYFACIPKHVTISPVLPKERDDEISSVSNERVKAEKYFAWRLLEHALKESLDLTIAQANIKKDENGKWRSEKCEFSISHSDSCVAVAISHAPVGIDIEPLGFSRSAEFAKKFLTDSELHEYSTLEDLKKDEFLLTRWCIKEAVFKKRGEVAFIPSKTLPENENVFIKRVVANDKDFICAVASDLFLGSVTIKEVTQF